MTLFFEWLRRFTYAFSGTIMIVLVIGVILQVVGRFLKMPSEYTEEIARSSLIWLTFLAGGFCFIENRHIALTLLEMKLKKRELSLLLAIIDSLVFIMSAIVLIWGGTKLTIASAGMTTPALQISQAYVYMIVPISGIIICLSKPYQVYQHLRQSLELVPADERKADNDNLK